MAVDISKPGTSLAYWLAVNVPDLFLWQWKQSQRAAIAGAAQALGQDDDSADDDDVADDASSDDTALDMGVDSGGVLTNSGVLSSDTPQEELGIPTSVPVDLSQAGTPVTDAQLGDATAALQSTGSSAAPSANSVTASMVNAVGAALTAPAAVASLANTALTYFGSNSNAAMADVFATQVATAAAGQPVQALTTVTDPMTGAATPAQVTTAADGTQTATPLTAAQLQALTPSGFTVFLAQYGVYLGVGAGLLVVLALVAHRGRHYR